MKFSIVHADCTLLVNEIEICDIFNSAEKSALKVSVAKVKRLRIPVKPKAPVLLTSPDKIKLILQDERLNYAQLQRKIDDVEIKLNVKGNEVTYDN